MAQWDDFEEKELLDHFAKVGATKPCPACGVAQWILPDRNIRDVMLPNFSSVEAAENERPLANQASGSIPCIAVLCGNCAFVRLHALGVLRLNFGRKPWQI